MIRLAVFASGNGSNAINLHHYFLNHPDIQFDRIYCNNPDAGILSKASREGIECRLFTRDEWRNGRIVSELIANKTDFIVLAGFLWLVPEDLITSFEGKIINIHPALLPAYGGKGMYGMRVHEAVIANGEKTSGITIHLVNKEYDRGEILFQEHIAVESSDTPETLAQKIHSLEHVFFPKVVEQFVLDHA